MSSTPVPTDDRTVVVPDAVTVVVVDDEQPLVDLVSRYLRREGYEVHAAYNGPEALDVIGQVDPDVVVLDLMLPGLDGLEVARRIRAQSDPYIVMLTARSDEVDRIVGLRVGADDYVTIDPAGREVTVAGEPVELTKLEFDLLNTLSTQPNVVFSKDQLLEHVWGSATYRDDHVVAVHVANLRRKLDDDPDEPRYIRTVRGVGYRMTGP